MWINIKELQDAHDQTRAAEEGKNDMKTPAEYVHFGEKIERERILKEIEEILATSWPEFLHYGLVRLADSLREQIDP